MATPPGESDSHGCDNGKSRTKVREEAFASMVHALVHDMPLLLHGSGDVVPSHVNPETVHLVSCLTAQYISKLVDASLSSHFTFLDEPEVFHVPPPSFPRHRLPPKPPPFSVTHKKKAKAAAAESAGTTTTKTSAGGNHSSKHNNNKEAPDDSEIKRKRPPKRLREEYWDEGLPTPKIVKKTPANDALSRAGRNPHASTTTGAAAADVHNDDDDDENENSNNHHNDKKVPLQEWVGAIGVDFRENVIRKAHVKNAVATPSFEFPICHDVYAYNRVREIRAAKRTLDPLLQDSTIQEMIQTEGRIHYVRRSHPASSGSRSSGAGGGAGGKKKTDDPQEDDDDDLLQGEEDGGGREWPGLDYVLPVNKLNDLMS
ncbi:hypothetical protein ACA910_002330 [Epithemia clementina (nom. ined.)]